MGDIPPVLLDFARRHGADQAGWRFVGASPAAIDRLVQRLDLLDRRKAQPTLADHRTALWLVDRQGRLRQRYVGQPVDRARLAHELQALAALDRP
jgi:cytochrome oxidase Cu insertion factor (SCO1/SenC/PrrC family)